MLGAWTEDASFSSRWSWPTQLQPSRDLHIVVSPELQPTEPELQQDHWRTRLQIKTA